MFQLEGCIYMNITRKITSSFGDLYFNIKRALDKYHLKYMASTFSILTQRH